MFGFSHSELQGLPVESLLPGELRRRHMANRLRYLGDPRDITAGIDREIHARRKDGREFPAEISLSHHTMAGGAAVVLCAIRDVTERIRSETLIAAQRDLPRPRQRMKNFGLPASSQPCVSRGWTVEEYTFTTKTSAV
jgi:PAS domain S-box-containing protein